jgi:S1-C subfamily serine protease
MTTSTQRTALAALSDDIATLSAEIGPRIVSVFGRGGRPSNGFILGDGLVLTPAHAIHRDHHLVIRTADGTKHGATLAGRDDATNVAVLRSDTLPAHAPVEAADEARSGQVLVGLARHPDGSLTAALVLVQHAGGTLRAWRGLAYDRVLRLDRGLPPTFAGAPLLDPRGRLAGIVLAGALRAAGLAASGVSVLDISRTVAREGSVARGYLGLVCQAVRLTPTQEAAAGVTAGLLVMGLAEDGAAARAGVLVGDVLLRFDDDVIADVEDLHARLGRERAGTVHRLHCLRGPVVSTVEVTLGAREARG